VYDLDGDFTGYNWHIPNPRIEVHPQYDLVYGFDWPKDTELTLTISGDGANYETTTTMSPTPWDSNYYWADFPLNEFDLLPGHILTISGGGVTKSYTVAETKLTNIDTQNDTISGIATPGAKVTIWANEPGGGVNRFTTADNLGNWMVDFSKTSDPADTQRLFDLQPGSNGSANEINAYGDQTWADDWRVSTPFIRVVPSEHLVYGLDWPINIELTLSIGDYKTSAITGVATWDPNTIEALFDLTGLVDLVPGDAITLSGGGVTKILTIPNLTVTELNVETDTLSGKASPNAFLCAYADATERCTTSGEDGNWTIEPATGRFALRAGISGSVVEFDPDGDQIRVDWYIPNPTILANPISHWIHALDWPTNTQLTLTIGDYSANATTAIASWDPNLVDAYFDLTGQVNLVPGDIVTVIGGGFTKTLIVTNIIITELNPETDTIAGTASPGRSVCSGANAPGDSRCTTAGEDGTWKLEPIAGGFILGPGVQGWMVEYDSDDDQTLVDWRVPNLRFDVRANVDQVEGYEWKMGETVTLQVGSYSETKIVEETASWDPNLTRVVFDLSGKYDIRPGDVLTLSNGTITKTTIATPLEITNFDLEKDIVIGKAAPDSTVNMWACDANNCYNRHVTADGSGIWLADFANPGSADDEQNTLDIVPGTWVDSQQGDDDSDTTMYGKSVPNHRFDVRPNLDQVEGYEWDMGESVTVQVGNYSETKTVEEMTSWDPNLTQVVFKLSEKYDIQPGDVVTLSDGTITKTTIVTPLEITGFDSTVDTVSGKAVPNTAVNLWTCDINNCSNRHVTADASGNWLADFAKPGSADDEQNIQDIVWGTWVDAHQVDNDGDTTMYGRNAPIPTHHIYTYDVKTGIVTQITDIPNANELHSSWSPNGKKIASMVLFDDYTRSIYVTDIETQVSIPLEGTEGGNNAAWSPNGQWIAFDTNYTDTPNLYIVPPGGGEKELVRENAVDPSWSPNSRRMVYRDLGDGGKLKTIDLLHKIVITVADSGYNPAWSPDGKWIAYVLDGDIWKVRVDPFGTPLAQPIQMTSLEGWSEQPSWSRDSQTIAFEFGPNLDGYELWSVPADGGLPALLYGAPQPGEYDPDFAHNGLIAFSGPVIAP